MVQIHIKKDNESQFSYDATLNTRVEDACEIFASIYNGRIKIDRICEEIVELCKYGTMIPPDEFEGEIVKCEPKGGWTKNVDPAGVRDGKMPNEEMKSILLKAVDEARASISNKNVLAGVFQTEEKIKEVMDMLKGAIDTVYPSNLPTYDNIRRIFETDDENVTPKLSDEIIDVDQVELWFANKLLERGKKLSIYLGKNEKTKVVLKITKAKTGPPTREPIFTEEDQKLLMGQAYKRQKQMEVQSVND